MVDPKKRRCDHECKDHRHDAVSGRKHIPSHPADPRQRVGNAQREPSPYVDLQSKPNITGTYFEAAGRYRLFINHVGSHIECLLTLVSRKLKYQASERKNKPKSARDPRLPDVWGPLQGHRNPPPLAFRFSGEADGNGPFLLEVPPWMLRKAGVLDPDGQLSIAVGTLEPKGGDAIDLVFDPAFVDAWPEHAEAATSQAFRANPDPVLLERYLDQPWITDDVRGALWFTRTPQQRDALPRFAARILTHTVTVNEHFMRKSGGTAMTLPELVEAAMPLGYGSDVGSQIESNHRNNIVTSIDHLVREVFEDPLAVPFSSGGLAIDDLEELRPLVLEHLSNVAVADKTTCLSGLIRTVDDANKFKSTSDSIKKYLGIESRGWGKHEYRVRLDLYKITDLNNERDKKAAETAKKAIEELIKKVEGKFDKLKILKRFSPIATLAGTAVVEYTGRSIWHGKEGTENDFKQTGWRGDYTLVMIGLQQSRGVGDETNIKWESTGWSWAGRPLEVDEVEGPATLIQTDLFGGGGKGKGLGETGVELTLLGGGGHGSVTFQFAGSLDQGKRGFRFGLRAMWGYFDLGTGFGSQIMAPPNVKGEEVEPFECYWKDTFGELSVHFPTNGAMLPVPTSEEREEMDREGRLDIREALNIFAACELPLLQDPTARIEIIGHADRPDGTDRNKELSTSRAESVLHYLHGLLGNRLTYGLSYEQLKGIRLLLEGRGEADAQKAQEDDNKADPRFRRVDVRVALPDPGTTDSEKDPEKDVVLELKIGVSDPAQR